jgi:periplasmic protein TonB
MPQEFLRDVLRTGDGIGRKRGGWSVLPLSIAGHAVVLTVFLFSPWTSAVELPVIAPPLPERFIETVAPPPPAAPPPSTPAPVPAKDTGAPIVAPPDIIPESPEPPRVTIEGGISHGPGVASGQPLLSGLSGADPIPTPPPPPLPPTPIRPGGIIREPRKILHVAPLYPDIARQSRVQGTVVLEAILDTSGRVESVRVLGSHPLLDDAAVRAVRQWRYTPTELNGVPVPVLMTITVRFSLER